jgi:lysophospholipase L1-like esterase
MLWDALSRGKRTRVSLDEYEQNLTAMIKLCRARGVKTVLFTAPSNPAGLTPGEGWYGRQPYLPLHPEYNDAVRRVAAREKTPLFDLDAMLALKVDRRGIFADLVHFNKAGHLLVGRMLADFFIKEGLAGGHSGPGVAPRSEKI